mgnify:FL=1
MMKKTDYAKLSIALIIIIAIIRFAFAAAHTVSGDACWHLSAARFIANENKLPLFEGIGRLQPFWAPPLFHFISAFLYKIFIPISSGLANTGSKLVSPIFGTLTIVVLYMIVRRFFDEKIAFYSMIFINFMPLFLDYSIYSYVDSTAAFFSVLSVYLMLNDKYVISSVSLGLALLSKYNAVFMYPVIFYLAYKITKNKQGIYKKLALVAFLPLAISSIWFIRNLILLGNPFWPFLNGIFAGVATGTAYNSINFSPLFSFGAYLSSYLEFFGVPGGNINLISFYSGSFLKYLFLVWLAATVIFIYPFMMGLFQKIKGNDKKILLTSVYLLFASYLLMILIYIINVGLIYSRLLLPIVPFMGIIWAKGLSSVKAKRLYTIILLVIGTGFIIAEGVKLSTATNEWTRYSSDFQWVKNNISKDAVFYGNGQCLPYNINRLVYSPKANIDSSIVDYVWINNNWAVDFKMDDVSLNKVKGMGLKIAYNNTKTGTAIYKVN